VSDVALTLRTEPCDPVDPLQVFAAAGSAARFYWEQPSARRFRVGIGCAARVSVEGKGRFGQADAEARALFDRIAWEGPGPRIAQLLGGFAFAPGMEASGPWRGFPDGQLTLPELTCWREKDTYVRNSLCGSAWADLRPRPLALGRAASGVVEFANGGLERYAQRVQLALDGIRSGRLEKVVVARDAHITAGSAIDPVVWLVALRERFPSCTLFAIGEGDAVFLGATPERLVRVRGETVETAAIAGTAARGASRTSDQALGEALLNSSKDSEEHAIVVRFMESALAACCDSVDIDPQPRLLKTRTVQHLCTELRGRRSGNPPVSLIDLVSRLHPTPAVGGAPREAALDWLAEHESVSRGWFAGPVGFLQSDGDGEFSVALRSALVRGNTATAWAGAGIVARSEAKAEFTETELKLRTALGPLLWGAP
jgi:salicylate biosynthesis isochorismate synthase